MSQAKRARTSKASSTSGMDEEAGAGAGAAVASSAASSVIVEVGEVTSEPSRPSGSMPRIYDIATFSPKTQLVFSAAKRNTNGGKSIPIQVNTSRASERVPLFQGPQCRIAFPVERDGKDYFSIECSLDKYQRGKQSKAFIDFIAQVDDVVKRAACDPANGWFSKTPKLEQVDVLYRETVRKSEAGWPPLVRFKVSKKTQLYDRDFVPISDYDVLNKNAQIIPIFELAQVYQISNGFGLTLRLAQAVVEQVAQLTGCQIDMTKEEVDEEEAEPASGTRNPEAEPSEFERQMGYGV